MLLFRDFPDGKEGQGSAGGLLRVERAFGRGAESMVRVCYAKTPEWLQAAMDRLEMFVAGYKA
jgi:hypothetical protein